MKFSSDVSGIASESDCKICPTGKYGDAIGQTSSEDCVKCDIGWYQDAAGQTECVVCPEGRYGIGNGETNPDCYGACKELTPEFYCEGTLRKDCPGDPGTFCYEGVRIPTDL